MQGTFESQPDSPVGETEGSMPVWQRLGRRARILLVAGLVVTMALAALNWASRSNRHRAATYGIVDPSSAALRVENKTNDFALTRVSLEDPERAVTIHDVPGEIAPGQETVLEIAPGAYVAKVFYVEANQVLGFRPKGSLSELITVSPGEATIVRFQGGRSSPNTLFFVPPELALK